MFNISSYIRKEKYRPATPTAAAVYVCHAQGTIPVFCNGLDWRALVED